MQEFPFAAPANVSLFNYVIIGVVAIAGIAGVAFGGSKAKRIMTAIVIIPVMFFLVRTLLPAPGGMKVTVGETMVVSSSYGKLEIAKSDVISAVVVGELNADPDLRPTLRTNGTAIGEYKLGWFTLANGKKAFIMTATPEVVALELPDKYVIVAPSDFAGFVRALNERFVPVE
ncbi:MAG: PH domain-containing protein [Chloroflexota bacterium]